MSVIGEASSSHQRRRLLKTLCKRSMFITLVWSLSLVSLLTGAGRRSHTYAANTDDDRDGDIPPHSS